MGTCIFISLQNHPVHSSRKHAMLAGDTAFYEFKARKKGHESKNPSRIRYKNRRHDPISSPAVSTISASPHYPSSSLEVCAPLLPLPQQQQALVPEL